MASTPVVRVAETVAFWALMTGLWLVTLSSVATAELVAAAALALPCAIAAGVARRAVGASWRWPRGWPRWLPPLPVAALADTGRVLAAVARRPLARGGRGHLERIPLPSDPDPARAAARLAASVTLLSLCPSSVVVASAEEELTVHSFAAGRPSVSEVMRR